MGSHVVGKIRIDPHDDGGCLLVGANERGAAVGWYMLRLKIGGRDAPDVKGAFFPRGYGEDDGVSR